MFFRRQGDKEFKEFKTILFIPSEQLFFPSDVSS